MCSVVIFGWVMSIVFWLRVGNGNGIGDRISVILGGELLSLYIFERNECDDLSWDFCVLMCVVKWRKVRKV
jgi:hypothetical protein